MKVNKPLRPLWAVMLLVFSSGGHAAFFSDDEARRAINRTEQNIRAVDTRVRQIEEAQRNQLDALNQLDQLRQDIAQLRGQIEVIQNDVEHAKQSQRDFYNDLDQRIKALESSAARAASNASSAGDSEQSGTDERAANNGEFNSALPANAASGAGHSVASEPSPEVKALLKSWKPTPANERKYYDLAMERWKANQYADAAPMFFHFSKLYPKSTLTPISLYYAGLSWRVIKNNASAKEALLQIAQYHPESPRMPNALFMLGQISYEQGEKEKARRLWQDVIDQFPLSDAAEKARRSLKASKSLTPSPRP